VAGQPGLSFAGLLRQLRADARLTQEELAEAASLSPWSVSDLERGINRTARKEIAWLLAGALGLEGPVAELFVAAVRRSRSGDVADLTGQVPGADAEAGPSTLRVAMLGGFRVRVGSRPVPGGWRLRKSKALVKLLALADGHRLHREVVTELLWPGVDPSSAAKNLHQALHAARRVLAADGSPRASVLCLQDDMVILSPGGDLFIDVDVFTAAGQRALRSWLVEDYRDALDMYTGELLPEGPRRRLGGG
jgi:transcriptional regulator with XRE-family HTH domain